MYIIPKYMALICVTLEGTEVEIAEAEHYLAACPHALLVAAPPAVVQKELNLSFIEALKNGKFTGHGSKEH